MLAEAIIKNPGFVCPAPNGYEACQTMRSGIERLLLGNDGPKSISADQMRTAMEECDGGVALEVYLEIAKIAADYIHLLKQYYDAVQYFLQLLQEVPKESGFDYGDWENIISRAAGLKATRLFLF